MLSAIPVFGQHNLGVMAGLNFADLDMSIHTDGRTVFGFGGVVGSPDPTVFAYGNNRQMEPSDGTRDRLGSHSQLDWESGILFFFWIFVPKIPADRTAAGLSREGRLPTVVVRICHTRLKNINVSVGGDLPYGQADRPALYQAGLRL
jgi:hypothetical protein